MKLEKLTKEKISEILTKKIANCTKEELAAITKLFGLQVKEFSSYRYPPDSADKPSQNSSVYFELHHKREYVVNVSADTTSRIVSYGNEWVNWGECSTGVAIPTDNIGQVINNTIGFFMEKLRVHFDGPEFVERRDYEYGSVEEMQELLEYAQSVMTKEADEEEDKEPEQPNVEVGFMKVSDVINSTITPFKPKKSIPIILAAVNEASEVKYTGVWGSDGKLYGTEEGNVLTWKELLNCEIKVGNINLK